MFVQIGMPEVDAVELAVEFGEILPQREVPQRPIIKPLVARSNWLQAAIVTAIAAVTMMTPSRMKCFRSLMVLTWRGIAAGSVTMLRMYQCMALSARNQPAVHGKGGGSRQHQRHHEAPPE